MRQVFICILIHNVSDTREFWRCISKKNKMKEIYSPLLEATITRSVKKFLPYPPHSHFHLFLWHHPGTDSNLFCSKKDYYEDTLNDDE